MNATQIFIATGFIRQISHEIDEAAQIDGCSFFGIFARIIFPLCKPLIATTGLMAFRTAWSDYLLPYGECIQHGACAGQCADERR